MGNIMFILLIALMAVVDALRVHYIGRRVHLTDSGTQRWGRGYFRVFRFTWGYPWGRVIMRRQARQVLRGGRWVVDTRFVKCTRKFKNLLGVLRTVYIGYTSGKSPC